MSNPLKNADKILHRTAETTSSTISREKYETYTKWLITAMMVIMKGPPSKYSLGSFLNLLSQFRFAAAYMNYHKAHLIYLAKVVSIFDEFQPIKDEITEMEKNITNYRDDSRKIVFNAEKLLSRQLYQSVGINQRVLLSGFSKTHPDFITKWNNYLHALKSSLKITFDVCNNLTNQGEMIVRDSKSKIAELKGKLDSIQEEDILEKVGKHQYKEKIKIIELVLLPKVSKSKSSLESVNRKILAKYNEVNSIERI